LDSACQAPGGDDAKKIAAFRICKLIILVALIVNLVVYLFQDIQGYFYLGAGASLEATFGAFATTIDYVAWMILILLFELETSAQAKDILRGPRKWIIASATATCYVVLTYAAYGYLVGLLDTYTYEPIAQTAACDLADDRYAYLDAQSRPVELTDDNCDDLSGDALLKSPNDHLIATQTDLMATRKLKWVDVVNAVAWLLIVLVFQVEILLAQAERLTKRWILFFNSFKILLYLVLAGNAIYWTFFGAFIDSWDAWLWLIAFVLIDLNLLGVEEDAPAQRVAQLAD